MSNSKSVTNKILDDTIEKSKEQAFGDKYISNTEEALNRGIFVASSYSVGNKNFWGDERLEYAIAFHRND